jgi:hypothetical protein
MTTIYSYVVRYDSGFAPNPFYGYCTLATCKPYIRQRAQIGDWLIGNGSNSRSVRRGGYLVYAMRVTEIMTMDAYSIDARFESKKPIRNGSRKQSCGDNIYFRGKHRDAWQQRDSFHSDNDGNINIKHVERDTKVNRVLISDDFVYFGGAGPKFLPDLNSSEGKPLCVSNRGYSCFKDTQLIQKLEQWVRSFGGIGFQGAPLEWITLRG